MIAVPGVALRRALPAHDLQFSRDARDAVLHPAAVGFQLRFTLAAAHPDAAFLPRQVAPETRQARQQVLQLRQLDLKLALAGARALREDVQNERGAVEHLAVEGLLQVAALGRGKLVVEDDRVYIGAVAVRGKLVRLAFADVGSRARGSHLLNAIPHYLCPGGRGKLRKLLQRIRKSTLCRVLSSTPTRKTRSVRRFLVSISAFNSARLSRSLSFSLLPA